LAATRGDGTVASPTPAGVPVGLLASPPSQLPPPGSFTMVRIRYCRGGRVGRGATACWRTGRSFCRPSRSSTRPIPRRRIPPSKRESRPFPPDSTRPAPPPSAMRLRRFTFTPSLHRIPFFILLICERSVWRSLTFENLAGWLFVLFYPCSYHPVLEKTICFKSSGVHRGAGVGQPPAIQHLCRSHLRFSVF
jgi:hypothetical protein